MLGALHLSVFLVVAVLAATPAYYFLRRTDEGRARGAIAYLSGFMIGLTGFVLLPTRDVVLSQSALLAAFAGPFLGMLRARYMRQSKDRRRQSRRPRQHVVNIS